MPQSAPGIQNKKLLLIAVFLGVVVVVVYNLHIGSIREEAQKMGGYKVRVQRDIRAGQKLRKDDLESVPVLLSAAPLLRDVVDGGDDRIEELLRANPVLNESVSKGAWLRYEYLPQHGDAGPARSLGADMVAVAIPLDRLVPGDILRQGGYVNLLCELPDSKGNYSWYRVMDSVLVNGIGGQGPAENPAGVTVIGPGGKTSYQSITVQVPKGLSLSLQNIITHARRGVMRIEVINPSDRGKPNVLSDDPAVKQAAAMAAKSPS